MPDEPENLPDKETLQEKNLQLFEEAWTTYLQATQHQDFLSQKDPRLLSVLSQFEEKAVLSPAQINWLKDILAPITEASDLEGDFKGIWIMFQIAGETLKRPKIRLITEENEYIELWFASPVPDQVQRAILLFQGGWQGHGQRRRIGTISDSQILPHRSGSISPSILAFLQEFSKNPAKIALASAQKLSACSFCGLRLSDPESKKRGYGETCASHYHLPWGKTDEGVLKKAARIRESEDLRTLF